MTTAKRTRRTTAKREGTPELLSEAHLLAICISGHACVRVGRKRLPLTPGRVALINPWQPYGVEAETGETLYLHLPLDLVGKLVDPENHPGWDRPQFLASSCCVGSRDLDLLALVRRSGRHVWLDESMLACLQVVRRVFTEMANAVRTRKRSTLLTAHPKVNRVLRFLSNADVETVGSQSLGSLSELAGLSKFHFLRTFHDEVGVSPHQYLRGMRLGLAARFLRETSIPVGAIAHRVGYTSVSSFSRSFTEHTGQTPTHFRKGFTLSAAA